MLLPQEADDAARALQLADERMYANKRGRVDRRGLPGQRGPAAHDARQAARARSSTPTTSPSSRSGWAAGSASTARRSTRSSAPPSCTTSARWASPTRSSTSRGDLSDSEWEFIRNHTILGERILQGAPALRPIARLVRASHERWDGSGYPDRLRGEEIPLAARIVSVCDAYEAMTTDRTYRPAIPRELACQELRAAVPARSSTPQSSRPSSPSSTSRADEPTADAAHTAVAHVRTLLEASAA